MRFEELVNRLGDIPVIDTEILLAGIKSPAAIKVQISRWKKAGKIIQLKRGIYLLAKPYRKTQVYELYLASLLKKPSYISMEKAFEFHGLIPEAVYVYTSVTTKRPCEFTTKVGVFDYRHIKHSLFWGYESVTLNNQTAFIASPEKALLDYFYLKGVKISFDYLAEMRFQNLEQTKISKMMKYARRFEKPKIMRAAEMMKKYIIDSLEK
jgi:predicted transcriptional regulator of viral defense system